MITLWTNDPTRNAGALSAHDPTAAPPVAGGGFEGWGISL